MKRTQNKNRLKTFCYNKWSMMQLTKWQFYHLLNQSGYISILEIKERAAWIPLCLLAVGVLAVFGDTSNIDCSSVPRELL